MANEVIAFDEKLRPAGMMPFPGAVRVWERICEGPRCEIKDGMEVGAGGGGRGATRRVVKP